MEEPITFRATNKIAEIARKLQDAGMPESEASTVSAWWFKMYPKHLTTFSKKRYYPVAVELGVNTKLSKKPFRDKLFCVTHL